MGIRETCVAISTGRGMSSAACDGGLGRFCFHGRGVGDEDGAFYAFWFVDLGG